MEILKKNDKMNKDMVKITKMIVILIIRKKEMFTVLI